MRAKSLEVGPATLAVVSLTNRAIEGAGLTRAHIEEAARISHNRLAVILRGERPPTVDELVRICEAVGVSAATILREAEETVRATPFFRCLGVVLVVVRALQREASCAASPSEPGGHATSCESGGSHERVHLLHGHHDRAGARRFRRLRRFRRYPPGNRPRRRVHLARTVHRHHRRGRPLPEAVAVAATSRALSQALPEIGG